MSLKSSVSCWKRKFFEHPVLLLSAVKRKLGALVSVDASRVAEKMQIPKSTKEILKREFRSKNKTDISF